jgi:hypothetical protein
VPFVIVDQKLIEAHPHLRSIGRYAIDTAGQMIYARHCDGPPWVEMLELSVGLASILTSGQHRLLE